MHIIVDCNNKEKLSLHLDDYVCLSAMCEAIVLYTFVAIRP